MKSIANISELLAVAGSDVGITHRGSVTLSNASNSRFCLLLYVIQRTNDDGLDICYIDERGYNYYEGTQAQSLSDWLSEYAFTTAVGWLDTISS